MLLLLKSLVLHFRYCLFKQPVQAASCATAVVTTAGQPSLEMQICMPGRDFMPGSQRT
jgi:hypothetical protein